MTNITPHSAMKLRRFRVSTFRSVDDSGWIEVDSVAGLIGTNESGKTNVLVPLWKLNPAKGGEIRPISDFPRNRYTEIRAMEKKPIFIRAEFERRVKDGQFNPVLAQEARHLAEWAAKEHPNAPQATPGTIENQIRSLHREAKAKTTKTPTKL